MFFFKQDLDMISPTHYAEGNFLKSEFENGGFNMADQNFPYKVRIRGKLYTYMLKTVYLIKEKFSVITNTIFIYKLYKYIMHNFKERNFHSNDNH